MEEIAIVHFKKVFKQGPNRTRKNWENIIPELKRISEEQREIMEGEYTVRKVVAIVKEMHPTKALGPDGF